MKKNVLALSIAAAVVGFGAAGSAQAMVGTLGGAGANTELFLNGNGVGQILMVPYYSAQDSNATLLNIVNTDTVRGKAVKVRFRGAANSDDVFDFQVFLSPGDVWTANVAKNADGIAQLTTTDSSCTKPAKSVLNTTPFVLTRLDPTLTAAQKANGTREGYVEIFNMADIPPTASGLAGDAIDATTAGLTATTTSTANTLYTAIKHPSKLAPPCSGTAWETLDTLDLQWNTTAAANNPRTNGLLPPTTGLIGNWTIINTVSAAAWSGEAAAVRSMVTTAPGVASTTVATGNVVYWPQTGADAVTPNFYTADPLLRTANVFNSTPTADATAAVKAGSYDLPDLSTPYTAISTPAAAAATDPLIQARDLSQALSSASSTNEFLTTASISASTDWLFSQPTRRYSVALDYAAISATDDGRRFSDLFQDTLATGFFLPANTLVSSTTNGNGRQICVKGIVPSSYDREENGVAAQTVVVVSPSTPQDPLSFCGEATVLSLNLGGILADGTKSLKASVAVKDLDVTYAEGWMVLKTPGATTSGLPVLGASYVRAFSGSQSFGATYQHRR